MFPHQSKMLKCSVRLLSYTKLLNLKSISPLSCVQHIKIMDFLGGGGGGNKKNRRLDSLKIKCTILKKKHLMEDKNSTKSI